MSVQYQTAYNFKIQNNFGLWNQGADAFSRYPANSEKQDEHISFHFCSEQTEISTTENKTTVRIKFSSQ